MQRNVLTGVTTGIVTIHDLVINTVLSLAILYHIFKVRYTVSVINDYYLN